MQGHQVRVADGRGAHADNTPSSRASSSAHISRCSRVHRRDWRALPLERRTGRSKPPRARAQRPYRARRPCRRVARTTCPSAASDRRRAHRHRLRRMTPASVRQQIQPAAIHAPQRKSMNGTSTHEPSLPRRFASPPDMPARWDDVELDFDAAAQRIIDAHKTDGAARDLPITDLKTWAIAPLDGQFSLVPLARHHDPKPLRANAFCEPDVAHRRACRLHSQAAGAVAARDDQLLALGAQRERRDASPAWRPSRGGRLGSIRTARSRGASFMRPRCARSVRSARCTCACAASRQGSSTTCG